MKKFNLRADVFFCWFTIYRNGPERTETDRNGPKRTGTDSENRKTDCFKSSFIYLISHNDRSGSKRTGTDSKIVKLVVSRPVFIIYIFLKTETDRNGLKNCKTCRFKASFYHQHNHNDRNLQKIAKQQTVSSPVLSIKLNLR